MINSILTSNAANFFYKKVLKTRNALQKAGHLFASSETGELNQKTGVSYLNPEGYIMHVSIKSKHL